MRRIKKALITLLSFTAIAIAVEVAEAYHLTPAAEANVQLWLWHHNTYETKTPISRERYETEVFCDQASRKRHIVWLITTKSKRIDNIERLRILEGHYDAETVLCSKLS